MVGVAVLLVATSIVIAVHYNSGYSAGNTTFSDGNLYYEVISKNEVSVTDVIIASGTLIIFPRVTYDGTVYTVISIDDSAFAGHTGFTGSLIIPDSVTTIGDSAFAGCGGTEFSVDSNNLYYKSVDGLLMSKDGTTVIACPIGKTGLLIMPDGVTTIGHDAFCNCCGFTGNLIIPDGVTTIGHDAFCNCCGFTGNLIIPDSVTTMGHDAFFNCCGFTGNLIIPDGVTTIGHDAFVGCGGTEFSVDSNNLYYKSVYGLLMSKDGTTVIACPIGKTGLLIMPDGVIDIDDYAFFNCCGFTGNLIIPDGVTTIGNYAFFGCSGFTGSLSIGNSVTTIGDCAFCNCCGFTGNLIIPDNAIIGDEAFFCYGLTYIVISSNVKFETSSPFVGTFYAEDGTTKLEQTVENLCGYIFKGYHVSYHIVNDHDVEMIRHGPIQEYTVTYDVNGGSVSAPVQSPVIDIEIFTVASYSGIRLGYLFGGWNNGTNNYAAGSVYSAISSNVTFTAIWIEATAMTYSVIYDVNGGSIVAPTQSVVAEGSTFAIASYSGTKTGYAFGGWSNGIAIYATESTYTMGTSDVTLTAVWIWSPSEYTTFYGILLCTILIVLIMITFFIVIDYRLARKN